MTLLASLLVWSCTNDSGREVVTGGEEAGEEVEITFSVSSESAALLSRADEEGKNGPGQWQNSIGRGQNIDMLIYAVYEENGGEPTLLTQYGEGLKGTKVDEDDTDGTDAFNGEEPALKNRQIKDGSDGYTIVNLGDRFKNGDTYSITLRLMRNKEYRLVFWAQSSRTEAFNTDKLESVTVNYAGAKNNDELRDAFCKVERFSVSPTSSTNRKVILTRPMAQINVGTTGADYRNIIVNENIYNNIKIVYSKITLKGVSNTINVVDDTIGDASNDAVTFDYDVIAAFYNIDKANIPTEDEDLYSGAVEGEELLVINLNHDTEIKKYKTNYPTVDAKGRYLTEEFKYLSMCYALVPAAKIASDDEQDAYGNSTLSEVRVYFAEADENGEMDESSECNTITLTNVPVHRNWRTNILGGLRWMEDPTDPDPKYNPEDPSYPKNPNDPDYPGPDPKDPTNPTPEPPKDPSDPSSVFSLKTYAVYMDNSFNGEFNGKYNNNGDDDDEEGSVDDWGSQKPSGDYPDYEETTPGEGGPSQE